MTSLSIQEVLFIHSAVIEETRGTDGVRDLGLLESALANANQTFGGQDLYPELADKAAALVTSLTKNHPFVDGNKRTAATVLGVFLELNGYRLETTQQKLVDFMIQTASEASNLAARTAWIRKHIGKIKHD